MMNITKIALVGLGGCIGTIARYCIVQYSGKVFSADFPYGTLAVNIIGSLVIGLIYGLADGRNLFTPEVKLFLTAGLCGGFTTFSSFSYESFDLFRSGQVATALLYMGLSNGTGLLAVVAGYYLSRS